MVSPTVIARSLTPPARLPEVIRHLDSIEDAMCNPSYTQSIARAC
jgi:hypothetical protein